MVTPIVEVADLEKSYDEIVAVDGLSFRVELGQIFGLVGPNGAGKTTTVECVEGLRTPDGGTVRVLGLDPMKERSRLYRRMAVQFQETSMYPLIRLREALALFAAMHPRSLPPERLLEEFGLEDRAGSFYTKLSGGQKRRFLTALALVGGPELVILDEPTSGLDPRSRRGFWATIERYRVDGLSVLLTTHDLQEAQDRCDVVVIIDRGRLVASGSPRELLARYRLGTRLKATVPADKALDCAALAEHPGVTEVEVVEGQVHVYGDGGNFPDWVSQMFREQGLDDVAVRTANLEDLYLILTGRRYEHQGEAEA